MKFQSQLRAEQKNSGRELREDDDKRKLLTLKKALVTKTLITDFQSSYSSSLSGQTKH